MAGCTGVWGPGSRSRTTERRSAGRWNGRLVDGSHDRTRGARRWVWSGTTAATLLLALALPLVVHGPTADAQTTQDGDGDAGEVVTVMTRNLYLGADVGVALELLPDMPAAAQFMWAQVAATDFTTRAESLAAEVARERPGVIGLQEATRWRCRPGNVGRTVDVFDFTAEFLAATRAAGVDYVIAERDGRQAFQPGFSIPALPFLSKVEDPGTFQPLFGRDTATCGFEIADALLVRGDLAGRIQAAGTGRYDDRYSVVPTIFIVDRGYAWADLAFDAGPVRFVTTHLESLWDEGESTHSARQARQLADDLAATAGPLVLMGDLNADPRDPRPTDAPNPGLQPVASEACPAQLQAPAVTTATSDCNAYWVLRQAGFDDAGPDALDPANLSWGTSAELAGPDPLRVDAALEMGNPYGFTDRLDYVLVRGGIEVTEARIIGNAWPDGEDLWPCDAPSQVANARAMVERLADPDVEGTAGSESDVAVACLPTDHAGVVAELRLPAGSYAASEPPPTRFRSPIGLWGLVGLLLLALLLWRIVRRVRRRTDSRR
jgi:hypothetical protein